MMEKTLIFALFCGLLLGCQPVVDEFNRPIGEVPTTVTQSSTTTTQKKNECAIGDYRVEHVGPGNRWRRVIKMPHVGQFVAESHYLTTDDKHISRTPETVTHGIEKHLERECVLFQKYVPNVACSDLFKTRWAKQWTPSESGPIGVGSRGTVWQKANLTPEQEMFSLNMMWGPGQRPKPGTKFVLNYDGRSIVVYSGHETGPGSKEYLGGVSHAVHFYLRANNKSQIVIAYPKDQSLPLGPIDCNIL